MGIGDVTTHCRYGTRGSTAGEDVAVDEAMALALHQPRHLTPAVSEGGGEGRTASSASPMAAAAPGWW